MPLEAADSAGAFKGDTVRVYSGGQFTSDQAKGMAWDGTRWVLFQPTPRMAATKGLQPVQNLRMAASYPTGNAASILWDLPAQSPAPTEVHVRVSQISPLWAVYPYPLTSWSHFALQPSTWYTVDVKLVLRQGLTVTESAIRSLAFQTTELAVNKPAEDPGPGTGTVILLPPLTNGGGVGVVGKCWWEWKVERVELDGTSTLITSGTKDGTAPQIDTADLPALTAGTKYVLCTRNVCSPGGPGAWSCTVLIQPTLWSDPCADHVDPRWAAAPYTDAAFIVPKVCAPDIIRDKVSGTEMLKGPAWGSIWQGPYADSGSVAMLGHPLISGVDIVVYGDLAVTMPTDGTLAMWVKITADLPAGAEWPLLQARSADLLKSFSLGLRGGVLGSQPWAYVYQQPQTPPFTPVTLSLQGTTALSLNTWHHLAVTYSAAGQMIVYLNGSQVGTAAAIGALGIA